MTENQTNNQAENMPENRTEIGTNMAQLLDISMMEHVVGGADYSYAYKIMSEMVSDYQAQLKAGVPEAEGRNNVKADHWNSLLSICKKYPEQGITPEQQAQVIFMLTIGS